jgi:hypothetical protein
LGSEFHKINELNRKTNQRFWMRIEPYSYKF